MVDFLRWLALPFDEKWSDADKIQDWSVTRWERKWDENINRPIARRLLRWLG